METSHHYEFDLERFMTREKFERIKAFAADKETPCLIIDLDVIEKQYDSLKKGMPFAKIYYAVKANPLDDVVKLLVEKGSCFDIASVYELNQVLALGATPDRISYGNTIKKAKDIAYAYEKGVRLFATDSESDLYKLAKHAPGSKVFFRILTDGSGADWPLSRKFGAHPDTLYKLILMSKELGLEPYGVSFHVGSQQRDLGQWDHAISTCKYLFDSVAEKGIRLKMINLGGGFPSQYIYPTVGAEVYGTEITRYLKEDFGENLPEIILEPGRYMAGDAGVMVTEVVLISRKSEFGQYRWIYLDAGKFGGLIETLDESIKYPIYVEKKGIVQEAIIAGPTCDSMDILYEQYKYELPLTLEEGDRVYILTTGAYTQSYSSVYFNGFPPLAAYILPREE
ncbi:MULTISPECIES: type III PLP-dependent enzyme [Aminobacterium]|uniref:ornithine decarboxylase n=1 Tax=Aminobacterium colombiense (strain DSM 12261 / ALA-1) TaxID=572547 RepID=D5ED53_AMICL|nr:MULTISPECIES: type III PLP-dependent enzyme [Aminobacterium]MDD2378775.1 type III PLP-dependent enzyme [Aminobacterium colombiense]ADE56485.1 Orn/DAP/Arg decarboxylase 2 [Aminobacterium colombiense DSM 12261]MDD3767345.1 type III PLP-dependent enzyme [Aminobacterium colombiense]MDD4265156.1 type III PLP-dependent enzyme [Aminobacterium colombiense]MDD4585362.1 type III PLP-dependent enzyme [Aminobacterium colombiense]